MHTVQRDNQSMKQSGLRSATQTQTTFQNLTIKLSQQLTENYLKQQNISFQVLSELNYDSIKKRGAETTQQLHKV